MSRSETRNWVFALKLTLPIIVFFVFYLSNHSKDLVPTGFVQYDNASYIAYAKQYLDAGSFHWQFANPFNDRELTAIYFQPQTLFFALLLKLGVPPGAILIPFTIICALVCFRLMIGIYDLLVNKNQYRVFSIWLFAWGGGVLVVAGIVFHFMTQSNNSLTGDLFTFDPEHGWWGLNTGRALMFSCEAYYHALFFGCIFFLLKKKWFSASVLLVVLLFSHPFTGIELIGIVCFWVFIEFILNKKFLPWWFVITALGCLVLYTCYYLVYLNQFPDHRSVADQYSLKWRLGIYRILPAYSLVGALAIVAIYKKKVLTYFNNYSSRLFACWFIIAFLLANHDLFMKARQPVHFTRGYIWTSLFLLGLPALQQLNAWLKNKWGQVGLVSISAVFFLDNFCWIALNSASKATQPSASYITTEQKEIFSFLDHTVTNQALLISTDNTISYLCTVYTAAYPWASHPYTTPFIGQKKEALQEWIQNGNIDSSWTGRPVVFVVTKNGSISRQKILADFHLANEKETANYLVMICDPAQLKVR